MPEYFIELVSIMGINVYVCYAIGSDGARTLHSAQTDGGVDVDVVRLEPILLIWERIFPDTFNARYEAFIEEWKVRT